MAEGRHGPVAVGPTALGNSDGNGGGDSSGSRPRLLVRRELLGVASTAGGASLSVSSAMST